MGWKEGEACLIPPASERRGRRLPDWSDRFLVATGTGPSSPAATAATETVPASPSWPECRETRPKDRGPRLPGPEAPSPARCQFHAGCASTAAATARPGRDQPHPRIDNRREPPG